MKYILTNLFLQFIHSKQGGVGGNITIDTLCSIMDKKDNSSALERYAKVNSLMLDTYQQKCQDFTYKDMVADLQKISWNSSAAEGGKELFSLCI